MLKPLVNSKEIVVSGSDVLNERRRITNDKAKTSYVRPLNLGNGIFAGKAVILNINGKAYYEFSI